MVRKALQAAQGEAGGSESPYSPKTLELLAGAFEIVVFEIQNSTPLVESKGRILVLA